MKLSIYQVDAFASKVFEGNPAAVCPLDEWLDDEVLQKCYMKIFSKAGIEVVSVLNGWDGFKKGSAVQFDLIITDYMMPNWDGIVTMEALVALYPKLKFLFVSGIADTDTIKSLEAHPNVIGFLQKPVESKILIETVLNSKF